MRFFNYTLEKIWGGARNATLSIMSRRVSFLFTIAQRASNVVATDVVVVVVVVIVIAA